MIVFLTLCYVAILALLIRLRIIPLNLWWKLSPIMWMLVLLVVLFLPMQWGAPSGPVNVYKSVVEVIPNVSGEVIEIPVRGLEPLKKGDVLFQIDPEPYQVKVDELQAQLAETKQNVERLRASSEAAAATVKNTLAEIEVAKADEASSVAAIDAAKAGLQEAKGNKQKAEAVVADLGVQVAAAQREYDRILSLVPSGVATKSERDRGEIQLTSLKSQLNTAQVDVRVADDIITRAGADVTAAEAAATSAGLRVKQFVEADLVRVRAEAREANLLANSMIGDEHTSVATAHSQLAKAQFDLEQTTVRAPSDGYVVGMSLKPGQRVAAFPVRTWMSFVPTDEVIVAVGIPQYVVRHVEPGQKVEVVFKLHPGRVFSATVEKLIYINEQGQLHPSGTVPPTPGVGQSTIPFGVRLSLDKNDEVNITTLPGGAVGTASVYTKNARATHIIRRVILRMETWMNYIIP
ncbi:Inner membrane protein YiaV precursor [Symmachiella macrocystis]|uniref:Inner membrane protein YiaV n=1 Tax=Symmachiella macrocystis TaxID=2527985 RepID=A0A5C6BNX9_9PLAN|nr:efflux RND transporter periplasmic adaptor subunit [Symmachiella macrocystis]TWU13392.1 Inner membrane protein YiaV precursor [Symmachiella macrocystis]